MNIGTMWNEKNMKDIVACDVARFWEVRAAQGGVLAGKQLDGFLELLKTVAVESGVPEDCIHMKNSHVPGYYRATKEWDFLIVSKKNHLVAAIELKSQVGSYGNNLNNRVDESLGSAEDFWTAFREGRFSSRQSPWLGYLMVVAKETESCREVKVSEPHYPVRPEFRHTTYLDRYRILCQRLVLEHKYNAVALIATADENGYENLAENISVESFLNSFSGHLIGLADEFE